MGHAPLKLIVIIGGVACVTAWSMVKSFFVRTRDEDPGARLDLATHPKLREVLDEVAAKIGTRAVDNVYFTPGVDIAVMERGGVMRGANRERCLILGAGVLDGMGLVELKAILAHEYGHFSNRDTAGGGFALRVRASLYAMAVSLARGGAATWYNPAWWFLRGFDRAFLRISQGASRLQEAFADRWAAFAYGSEAFARGVTHVVRRSIVFDLHVQHTINEVTQQQRPLANLYAYTPETPGPTADIDALYQQAFNREPSPFDSHPSPKDRLQWVRALAVADATSASDERAWSLFADASALQELMTAQVRTNLATRHGIRIKEK